MFVYHSIAMKHLFALAPGVMFSLPEEEVMATAAGLREVGLFQMPYDRDVYIEISARECVGPDVNPDHAVIYGPLGAGQECGTMVRDVRLDHTYPYWSPLDSPVAVDMLKALLIVLLATKNADKNTVENKLAKLGIGKKHKTSRSFASTTTISLPTCMHDDEHHPPKGIKVTPHLRRGHVRHQHFGAGNENVKMIWIAPVFVNADPDFVATRKRYMIGGKVQ